MGRATKVLLVGTEEWASTVRKALPLGQEEAITTVESFWKLCALPESVLVEVAVFHHSFSKNELRYAAEYIRRRWPLARILLLGWKADSLDDPLYDDRKRSGILPEELVQWIAISAKARRRIESSVRTGSDNVRA